MSRLLLVTSTMLVLVSVGLQVESRNKRLTATNVAAARPGMSMDQVKAILGEPISMDSTANYRFSCPCNAERICTYSYSYTFNYTSPVIGAHPYPMLWVHFNSRKRVRTVYVKECTAMDSKGIYWAVQNPCDTSDTIVPLSVQDSSRISDLRVLLR